jgi:hypothetical protein
MQTATSESLYRRLQQHLDRMPVGFPATESGVEIRILQRLFTPEEAEIALELSAIPETAAIIYKRLKSRSRSWTRWGKRGTSWLGPSRVKCTTPR